MGEAAGEADLFEVWRFDDEFVLGAAVSEASAEERIEHLRRLDVPGIESLAPCDLAGLAALGGGECFAGV